MVDPGHYDGRELEALSATSRYQRWIVEQFAPYLSGRIMEIGAGIGTMAHYWLDYSDELHLVEPAHNLYAVLEREFGAHPAVTLHCGTLEDVIRAPKASGGWPFDAVVMVNVLEHIADDAEIIRTIFRLLKPGGRLLVFVPALPALYGSLDRVFGHYRRYTKSLLEQLVAGAGFGVVRVRYFDILGVLPWWIVGRLARSRIISPTMAGLYDRIAVPVGRVLETVVPPPFGKNLVLIARKNGA